MTPHPTNYFSCPPTETVTYRGTFVYPKIYVTRPSKNVYVKPTKKRHVEVKMNKPRKRK